MSTHTVRQPADSSSFEKRWEQRNKVAATPLDEGLFIALAPMDGVTDFTYRSLITSLSTNGSGISQCVSEFVRVTNQRVPAHVIIKHCPEVRTGGQTPSGVPVYVQLLGSSPQWMAHAAATAADLGAPGIDINFGCPAKTVNNSDGGATLLKDPQRVLRVTTAVREAVPEHIPVTAKIRIGWDSGDRIKDLAKAAEDGGAKWLTIHARTRAQLYRPPVHWSTLAKAVDAICIPVVANGDLFSVAAVQECARVSDCDAFMIGRGAMAHPNLFEQIRSESCEPLAVSSLASVLVKYTEVLLESGASERHTLGRVKQWLRMGAAIRGDMAPLFDTVKRAQGLTDTLNLISERNVPPG